MPDALNSAFTFIPNVMSICEPYPLMGTRTGPAGIGLMVAKTNFAPPRTAVWVDNPRYFGPDRRGPPSLVVNLERRLLNSTCSVPSLWSALRKLRFHVLDAYGRAGLVAFIDRTKAVALLADQGGELAIWEELTNLEVKLMLSPAGHDLRVEIFRQIDSICTRGSAAV